MHENDQLLVAIQHSHLGQHSEQYKSTVLIYLMLKPWSPQNPFLFLKIQVLNKIIWFEMHRKHQQTPRRLSLSHFALFTITKSTRRFLRFFASRRSSLHKIGME